MSYIKNAYLDLSEELGLAPAQLLEELTEVEVEVEEDEKYAYSNAEAYEDYKSAEINGMGR
jgi:hypothetical protein